ncbi:tRNA pseudouridine(54/55) synthase Pus10 [Candidatus Bipolaricaulota bacterium]|nr:tRNA pseudouridine(54/55) synthase Pus10 [Candidatus Bipolaricaulota bacterium]
MSERSNVVSTGERILEDHEICDNCLGRLFGKLSHGLTNRERGMSLRTVAGMDLDKPLKEDNSCEICLGLYSNLDDRVEKTVAEVEEYEFSTFLFGNRLRRDWKRNQERIVKEYDLNKAEDFSHAVNRVLGKRFREKLKQRGITVEADFETPDLTVLLDFENGRIETEIRSVYVYGRYRKLARGIPQTVWTEKGYSTSVEEIISPPARAFSGAASSLFHGGGREDVDVLCLGRGRPFVLELEEPKVRKLDLDEVADRINESKEVQVSNLRKVPRKVVEEIKSARPDKIYRALIESNREIEEERFLEGLKDLVGRIFQRTPTRVSHRRSDLVRVRQVYGTRGRRVSRKRYEAYIWAESGLYIKELITSDRHRSLPSFAGQYDCKLTVAELDVANILGKLEKSKGGDYSFEQDKEVAETIFTGIY